MCVCEGVCSYIRVRVNRRYAKIFRRYAGFLVVFADRCSHGLGTVSRIDKSIGLFCKRDL